MIAPTAEQVEDWQRTLAAHTLRNGICPVCKVPHRCRDWAEARGWLIAYGLLPDTPPAMSGDDQAGKMEGDER